MTKAELIREARRYSRRSTPRVDPIYQSLIPGGVVERLHPASHRTELYASSNLAYSKFKQFCDVVLRAKRKRRWNWQEIEELAEAAAAALALYINAPEVDPGWMKIQIEGDASFLYDQMVNGEPTISRGISDADSSYWKGSPVFLVSRGCLVAGRHYPAGTFEWLGEPPPKPSTDILDPLSVIDGEGLGARIGLFIDWEAYSQGGEPLPQEVLQSLELKPVPQTVQVQTKAASGPNWASMARYKGIMDASIELHWHISNDGPKFRVSDPDGPKRWEIFRAVQSERRRAAPARKENGLGQ